MAKKLYLSVSVAMVAVLSSLLYSPPTLAADCGGDGFLGIPAWHRGLVAGDCTIEKPVGEEGMQKFAIKVALNITQALMVVVAYVTIIFLIKGGFDYMTSAGDQQGTANAKKTITNSLIGLVIAILAASIVSMVAGTM